MERFAVIPTNNRPIEYRTCFKAIRPQVDRVFTICHGSEALRYTAGIDTTQLSFQAAGRPNISTMWNMGLNHAAETAKGPYRVAVLNDDAIPAPDWFDILESVIGDAQGASERRHQGVDQIAGWAFILDGSLRADENLHWWFGDDDLQRQASRWAFADIVTPNTRANSTSRSREARAQIEADSRYFHTKWAA